MRQLPLVPPAPTLTNPQRWALALAAHGWGVEAEGVGASVTLRRGSPRRALVLYLSDAARAADDAAARQKVTAHDN